MRASVLSLAAVLLAAACAEPPTAVHISPGGPDFELVNEELQRRSGNVSVLATFRVEFPGGTIVVGDDENPVPGVNDEGKELGWCYSGGRWLNPSGKNFSKSVPHTHCIRTAEGRVITLEGITARHVAEVRGGKNNQFVVEDLDFGPDDELRVRWHGQAGKMMAEGLIVAHAVDQSGTRHGTFTFDLAQYAAAENLFGMYELVAGGESVYGLPRPIMATYNGPDGNTVDVEGSLYWTALEPE